MAVVIDIVGTEIIKPSSPTPAHLQHYPLSFTDQNNSTAGIPITLCYPPNKQYPNSYQLKHLKKSLSNALTLFYPLAGRIVVNSHVNCNDAGVSLVETRVHSELSQVIKNPNVGEFVSKFIPSGWNAHTDVPLFIQANFFKCGGMAIGLGISHKVADVPSFMLFIQCLAAIGRGVDSPSPKFDSATLFPPLPVPSNRDVPSNSEGQAANADIVTKRFVINPSSIASLKHRYSDAAKRILATKVEAVSAFTWTRLMASTEENPPADAIFLRADAVDLRPVADPPISPLIFGNIGWISLTTVPPKELYAGGYKLVIKMREAERELNAELVARLKKSDPSTFAETFEKYGLPGTIPCVTSSFSALGLHETDMGWGKPIWVASATFQDTNAIILLDTDTRVEDGGLEVWMNLTKENMAKFEVDKEFLSFTSPP